MMVTNASVCAWDSPTRGLDASTAVDYVRSIRVLSDIHRTSTFITAYQVSESIYREFDKVMVLHQGRLAYFGPANSARSYFEGLGYLSKPRQTTADYLTGCTDPFEREYRPGRSAANVPTTPEELAAAFDKSAVAADLEIEMAAYQSRLEAETRVQQDFLAAVKQSKFRTSSRNVYSIPFYLQVWALMKRQFLLKKQDTFSLTVSWTTVLLIAMLLSTLWVNQPQTSAGAFTRGGVIFISFLFNGFQAFGELAGTMLGRPVVSKHRAYTFYRPSALWIAQVFIDMAFQSLVITSFALMVYFSTGLVHEPGAFFAFLVTIMSGYLCMTLVFRTIGILSRDFDIAMRAAALLIAMLVLTSGYPIQYPKQKVWIRWLFWVNPAGLGFSSLMMNEFKRLNLRCVEQSLIPNGPGYANLNYQVCTLLGSVPGNPIVSGTAYVKALFGYNIKDEWRNFSFIWILIIFFLTMTIVLGEYINWGASGRTITLFAKEDKERKELNEALMARKEQRGKVHDNNQAANIAITSKSVLTWEAVNYDVPIPSGHKRILNDVYGYVQPGVLTALMGASGAGKTTLLDVLASRKNIGVIYGDIFVDGRKPGLAFQRGTAYAEQLDVHEPAQTVREALRFSADLRQPFDTPQAEKYAYVEEVISLLELEDIADAIIGSPEAGLAPDQRKLLTIGVELAAKPQLLLFLDEPTTGLDSQSAWNIARFLRKLTAAGQAVLCTIHQPNSALFQQFDRLLLLQKGGECVYFGDIGDDAAVLRDYFRRNGAECPVDANPAEWMLDAVGAGLTPRLGDRDWGEIWASSPEFARLKREIVAIKTAAAARDSTSGQAVQREYATPLWHQIKHVVRRQSLSFWRTPNYGFTRLFNHVSIAMIAGLIFIHLDDSRQSLQDRIFLIFQFTVLPAIILAQVQPKYAMARTIAHREQDAKAYRTIPFALSMAIAETPYSLLCAVGFFLPIHYIPGMQSAPDRAGYELLMTLVVELFAVALGQMVAAATPSPKISALLNPPIIITFALFSGVTIPAVSMPRFWRVWLWQLDPFSRLIGGMLVTELQGRPVVCRPEELSVFNAPPNTTCGAYTAPFFARGAPGYIVSNDTTRCEYCAYKVGDEFYEALGYSFGHRWRDLGIISAYILSSIMLTLLAVSGSLLETLC
jgi:ABC-type multidrug transport system ATPase subunit/ABC-type multidrug transport system permease subunit